MEMISRYSQTEPQQPSLFRRHWTSSHGYRTHLVVASLVSEIQQASRNECPYAAWLFSSYSPCAQSIPGHVVDIQNVFLNSEQGNHLISVLGFSFSSSFEGLVISSTPKAFLNPGIKYVIKITPSPSQTGPLGIKTISASSQACLNFLFQGSYGFTESIFQVSSLCGVFLSCLVQQQKGSPLPHSGGSLVRTYTAQLQKIFGLSLF